MAEAPDRSAGWIGKVLHDKWRIDARIARGGVATVFRATHRQGQLAAIKILNPEYARNDEVRRRFRREGYVANKVGHRDVVRVIEDDVTDDGTAYLVMELLEEGELLENRRMRLGGRLPVEEAVDVCVQILDVLAVAHEKGIIHRDIKPENVFVLESGTVKVLDFGIAHLKEAAKQQESTATGLMLGTPEYMSPEQVVGKRGEIDAQTDVYAVGATLFMLLSGEPVHVCDKLNLLLVMTASRQARSLASAAFKDLPRPLIAVVDKALALEKPRRWASARAMQAALRDAMAKANLQARGATEPTPQLEPESDDDDDDDLPTSARTLVKAPSTTVIPMRAAESPNDPWTDDLDDDDDLDGPTVSTGGPLDGLPSPSLRSVIVARPPLPSMQPGEPTNPHATRADLLADQATTVNLTAVAPGPARRSGTSAMPTATPPPSAAAPGTPRVLPAPRAPVKRRQLTLRLSQPPSSPRVDLPPSAYPTSPAAWRVQPVGPTHAPPAAPAPPSSPSRALPSPLVLAAIAIAAFLLLAIAIGSCLYLRAD